MQQLSTYTWHPMPAFTCAHATAFAMVGTQASSMMRCIEMEIKQVKIII